MTNSMTVAATENVKSDVLKHKLLADIQTQQVDFMQTLDAFYATEGHTKQDYMNLAAAMIQAADGVLSENDTDSSLFLRNTVKPIKEMRERAIDLLNQLETQDERQLQQLQPTVTEDQTAVYVLVFQSQGYDLDKWAHLLRSLGCYVLGRPIYENEADVQAVIRGRNTQNQEGYVKVAVARSAIVAGESLSKRTDRSGNKLLSLPAGAVSAKNILGFVQGKTKYYYMKGKLIDESTTKRY